MHSGAEADSVSGETIGGDGSGRLRESPVETELSAEDFLLGLFENPPKEIIDTVRPLRAILLALSNKKIPLDFATWIQVEHRLDSNSWRPRDGDEGSGVSEHLTTRRAVFSYRLGLKRHAFQALIDNSRSTQAPYGLDGKPWDGAQAPLLTGSLKQLNSVLSGLGLGIDKAPQSDYTSDSRGSFTSIEPENRVEILTALLGCLGEEKITYSPKGRQSSIQDPAAQNKARLLQGVFRDAERTFESIAADPDAFYARFKDLLKQRTGDAALNAVDAELRFFDEDIPSRLEKSMTSLSELRRDYMTVAQYFQDIPFSKNKHAKIGAHMENQHKWEDDWEITNLLQEYDSFIEEEDYVSSLPEFERNNEVDVLSRAEAILEKIETLKNRFKASSVYDGVPMPESVRVFLGTPQVFSVEGDPTAGTNSTDASATVISIGDEEPHRSGNFSKPLKRLVAIREIVSGIGSMSEEKQLSTLVTSLRDENDIGRRNELALAMISTGIQGLEGLLNLEEELCASGLSRSEACQRAFTSSSALEKLETYLRGAKNEAEKVARLDLQLLYEDLSHKIAVNKLILLAQMRDRAREYADDPASYKDLRSMLYRFLENRENVPNQATDEIIDQLIDRAVAS